MQKQNSEDILRQILINIKKRKKSRKKKSKPAFLMNHQALPRTLSLSQKGVRTPILKIVNNIRLKNKSGGKCYLDFQNVEIILPDGGIHLTHVLHKYALTNVGGRISKSSTVKAMLSKLGIHSRMGKNNFSKQHAMIDNWHVFIGEGADFGEDFVSIQNYLSEIIQSEKNEFIINTAISEAVTNVTQHAYNKADSYRSWVLIVGVFEKRCHIVISDLGKTIPVTAPLNLWNKFKVTVGVDSMDADTIETATSWRKSTTNQSYRGKGFDNIVDVNNVRSGVGTFVQSRRGLWSSQNQKTTKRNFVEPLEGTIIHWLIPLDESEPHNLNLEKAA